MGVVITDIIPVSVTHSSLNVSSSGASITPTGNISYAWNVEDLNVGEGGVITISGILSAPLAAEAFTNTAIITAASVDTDTSNNNASAKLTALNIAPIADTGNPQTVDPAATVQLNGSASSDINGDALTYGWTQTGGASVTLSGSLVVSPTFTAPAASGVLTFSLIVTDSGGLSDSDAVTVTVRLITYTLDVVITGSGEVSLTPPDMQGGSGGGTAHFTSIYTAGITVTLTATPANGWSFDAWSGDGTADLPLQQVLMNDNKVVTATFTQGKTDFTVYLPLVMK